MKASELRIGNIVGFYGKEEPNWFKITATNIKVEEKTNKQGYTRYRPIPVTEEWLIKFGFEKPAHSWIGDKLHLTEWDDYPLNWCVAFNKNNAIIVDKLKYIHQLQNLYFALTGEELKTVQQ